MERRGNLPMSSAIVTNGPCGFLPTTHRAQHVCERRNHNDGGKNRCRCGHPRASAKATDEVC